MENDNNIKIMNKDILEMDETVKGIENKISQIEDLTKQSFEELGRKTYELHKAGNNHECQQAIDQINKEYAIIESGKNEIERVKREFMEKNMKKPCPHCGALGTEAAKYCRICGNTYEIENAVKMRPMFCIKCGSELDEDSVFCSGCGRKVN